MKHSIEVRFYVLANVCNQMLKPLPNLDDLPHWTREAEKHMSIPQRYEKYLGDLGPQASRVRYLVGCDPLPEFQRRNPCPE